MKRVVHKIASWLLKRRIEQIEQFMRYPHETQLLHFKNLIRKGSGTAFGKEYGFEDINQIEAFRRQVPISTYEDFFPYIDRAFNGEDNVIWPGKVSWFAKSSGTTNDKSKFIPVSEESLSECHFQAGQDMLGLYFDANPQSMMFAGKSLSIGGSLGVNPKNEAIRFGDVSAVIVENLPIFFELMRTPSKEVAMMPDWDEKLEAMAAEVVDVDVTCMAGVPTWTLLLVHRLLEMRGISSGDLREIWPNLELYVHGGVSFDPYRAHFDQLIPHPDMHYLEVYNASEGFFALQNDLSQEDLLLMLDYGIFYEFIPMEHLEEDHPPTHILEEVEIGKNYAMVISTNGGLWRYLIGDTITFTSKYPYKIKITGRTKHFINAFGEELMVNNAEGAIKKACEATGSIVGNYTAAPIYFHDSGNGHIQKGGHEWLIEFETPPSSPSQFQDVLDKTLMDLNSDYAAKRVGDLALGPPVLHTLPEGTFYNWMKKRGKLGGQHKVPRLSNSRAFVEEIMEMVGEGRKQKAEERGQEKFSK